jgi:hypothetical protein
VEGDAGGEGGEASAGPPPPPLPMPVFTLEATLDGHDRCAIGALAWLDDHPAFPPPPPAPAPTEAPTEGGEEPPPAAAEVGLCTLNQVDP